jgi:hypothetical protein
VAVTTSLPDAGLVAWWCTSWIRGEAVTDLLLDALDHLEVAGGWLDLLVDVRRAGAAGAGLALPVEGDPLGLGGPPAFNAWALGAGSAVVFAGAGVGLVPEELDGVTSFRRLPAAPRQVPDVGEADRGLRLALATTADRLAALDVGRWRPEVADELMDLRRPGLDAPPPGVPSWCGSLAARAVRATRIVELARQDDGAAVSAYEIETRWAALRPLDHAARRALVAACSVEAWPPD